MNTRRNSKWTIIGFLIAVSLLLMACTLFSAASSKPTSQVTLQASPTAQTSGTTDTPVIIQPTPTAVSTLAPTDTPTPTTAPSPTSTPQPVNLTPTIQLPQSFTYADLQFNITRAVITNQVSDTNPAVNPSQTFARLSIQVVNPTNLVVTIPDGVFTLKLGDGTSYTQNFLDKVAGKDSGKIALQFIVPANETWSGAQLILNENGAVPGVVLLDGTQPASQYPITLTAGQKLTLKQFRPMTYTITSAVMDQDGLGVRAKIGNHYLVLGLTAFCNNSLGCFVASEEMRLIVDGTPESVETIVPDVLDVAFQATVGVQASFVVPDSAAKLVFEVGEVDKETTQTPITLK